jgi:hypothetical protein
MPRRSRLSASGERVRRAVFGACLWFAAAALTGCPIYDHEAGRCIRSVECAPGYSCDRNSGACIFDGTSSSACNKPEDCGPTETCTSDRRCAAGDCSFYSCVSGYHCQIQAGQWSCVPEADAGLAGAGGDSGAAGEAGAASAGVAGL